MRENDKERVDAVSSTARDAAIANWRLVSNFNGPLGVLDLETGQWWEYLLRGLHQELIRGRDSEKPLEQYTGKAL